MPPHSPSIIESAVALTHLGRYEIQARLGEGAMGKVYRAFDPLLERAVALKTINLRIESEDTDHFVERFYREAKSAGCLNHPNIVTIYDVGQIGELGYIAMELLPGPSLRQLLDQGEIPSPEEIRKLIAEMAGALAYAHAQGVVHRDIKPANIVLGPNRLPKLTDFGIARLPSTAMTLPGVLLGSPKYMSPEQIQGGTVDGRSDVFSLGVVLYEMLTRRAPFEGSNLNHLMYAVLNDTPPPPSKVVDELTPAFDAVLARALAKRPDDRFQTAADLATTLGSLDLTQPAATPEPAAPAAAAPPVRKVRWSIYGALTAAGVAILALGVGLLSGGSSRSGGAVATPRTSLPPQATAPADSASEKVSVLAIATPKTEASSPPGRAGGEPSPAPVPPLSAAPPAAEPPAAAGTASPTPLPQVTNGGAGAKGDAAAPGAAPDAKAAAIAKAAQRKLTVAELRSKEIDETLAVFRKELADLSTRFTDKHPDVRAKQRQIRLLEAERNAHASTN